MSCMELFVVFSTFDQFSEGTVVEQAFGVHGRTFEHLGELDERERLTIACTSRHVTSISLSRSSGLPMLVNNSRSLE